MTTNNLDFDKRRYILVGIICSIIFIYICQLFYLQVMSNHYKDSADNNAFFNRTIYPARGTIKDRYDRLLVYNQPTYDLVYIPREVQPFDTLDLCNILDISKEQFLNQIANIKDKRKNPGYSLYTQQTFMTQLSVKEAALIQEKEHRFQGFYIQKRTIRQYDYHSAGLILGYVAEVDRDKIAEDPYYRQGDYAGKSGIEYAYENHLRGEKGVEILLRDARGRIQGKYEGGQHDIAPVSGRNLTLSLDVDLQTYAEQLLTNKVGCIVMIEPATGELLCLATSPSYDPALLVGREFGKNYLALERNPLKPLLNRALQGTYPPGSTFKTTQGLVFLEEDIITKDTHYSCAMGYPPLGGRPKCHGHGSPLPLIPALATSCNSYFCYGLTAMLSNKKYGDVNQAFEVWKNHMVDMGFGYKLGVDLPYEKRGFIPNSEFYSRYLGKNWKASNVISIAIGQGEVLVTPLQGANLAATIANRGYFYTPHIVKAIQDTILDEEYTTKRYTGVRKEHYEVTVQGMADAVTGGTCRGINIPGLDVCGKTGTAENPHGRDHSLFMGFAPKNKPEVAMFIIVENGGFGASMAVPMGRLMMKKHFKQELTEDEIWKEQSIINTSILPSMFYQWQRNRN